ncbi:hypothetical protein BMR1_03g01755 [Babesia microti strain RI]|uniref:Uncharacterized protein n=1 Tax=Babesia microti (strain RI) TaxID=1133968 RepID=A0A0K3AR75_BABMR|nr:hypothetical protein BMR1_03g01755 [Babesia microti strain RI]CTQ40950.1 hypothetical protein BMR1_03g01755 [Babesia microti strain RI]|eukprot:XP_012648961.1 hypothetical protein BMR1_03g01755 [Babesia microti strain RI]
MKMSYKKPPLDLFEVEGAYAASVCSSGAIPQKFLIAPIYKDISKANTNKIIISPPFCSKRFLTLDEIQELICYNFVKRGIFYADEALYNEKLFLYDKLIYQIFHTINYVYSLNKNKPQFEVHPLFNWRESIPLNTPKSICKLIEEMSNNKTYQASCCKVAMLYEFMDQLQIDKFTKMCKNYRQHVLDNLYNEVYNEVMHSLGLSALTSKTLKHIQIRSNISNYEKEELDKSQFPILSLAHGTRRYKLVDWEKVIKARLFTARLGRFRKRHGLKVNRYFKEKEFMLRGHLKSKQCVMDGWIKESSKKLHTYYRKAKNGKVSIKLRCKLPVEFIKIACILRECDFANEWVPFLTDSKLLGYQSKGCYVIYHKYNYPVIGIHDMLLYFIGVNAMEEANSLLFISSSPPETLNEAEHVKNMLLKKYKIPDASSVLQYRKEGNIFLDADFSKIKQTNKKQKAATIFFSLYPIYGGKYTIMEINANVISCNPLTPIKLVSYITLKVAKGIVKGIYKLSKKFSGTKFEKRMIDNSEYYIWCGNILRDSMGSFPPGLVEEDPQNSKIDIVEQRLTATKADISAYVDIEDISVITYDEN